jgi:hypothetical protein
MAWRGEQGGFAPAAWAAGCAGKYCAGYQGGCCRGDALGHGFILSLRRVDLPLDAASSAETDAGAFPYPFELCAAAFNQR